MSYNRAALTAGSAILLFSIAAVRFTPAQKGACSLLSTADASAALGQTSLPGAPEFGTGCVWSPQSPPRDTSRQLHVEYHTIRAYDIAKHGNILTKIEPVGGVGEDAFYQLYPKGGSPFLWVKKGDQSISIRVSTGTKVPLFSESEFKSKLLALGKTAVAKM
jgi:hypothetical protein